MIPSLHQLQLIPSAADLCDMLRGELNMMGVTSTLVTAAV